MIRANDAAAELRRLATNIQEMARASTAYSLVHKEIDVLTDHLFARARLIEYNRGDTPPP